MTTAARRRSVVFAIVLGLVALAVLLALSPLIAAMKSPIVLVAAPAVVATVVFGARSRGR